MFLIPQDLPMSVLHSIEIQLFVRTRAFGLPRIEGDRQYPIVPRFLAENIVIKGPIWSLDQHGTRVLNHWMTSTPLGTWREPR